MQLVGVFIALVGVLETQREYKEQDEPWMLDWVFTLGAWIARLYRRARDWLKYVVLRRPRPNPKLRFAHVGLSGAGVLTAASGQVIHGPLPEGLSLDERVRLLDLRTRQDNDTLNRVERELIAERQRIDNAFAELDARTAELKQHTSASLRAYATRGIKASALGLFLTALGMLLSAFAQPFWIH